jgi:hypothetical protein
MRSLWQTGLFLSVLAIVIGPHSVLGANRDKFQNAQEIQQLSGIAPVTRATGTCSGRLVS